MHLLSKELQLVAKQICKEWVEHFVIEGTQVGRWPLPFRSEEEGRLRRARTGQPALGRVCQARGAPLAVQQAPGRHARHVEGKRDHRSIKGERKAHVNQGPLSTIPFVRK